MPRAYSPDLRARVLAASQDDHLSHRAVGARFRVGERSVSTVRLWLRRVRETGAVAPRRTRATRAPGATRPGPRCWRTWSSGATSARSRSWPTRTASAPGSPSASTPCGGSHGLPLQAARPQAEKKSLHAAEQAREDVAAARAAWAVDAPALTPEDLVFVDALSAAESGIATNMARVYGRAKGGRRAGVGARTVGALNAAMATLVDAITAEDARGYFRHCGYAAPR